jgi:hypothetical protein
MKEYPYRALLNRARNDLADALSDLFRAVGSLLFSAQGIEAMAQSSPDSPERRIAQSCARIRTIYAHADKFSQHRSLQGDVEDLEDAICTALRFANRELSIEVILRVLTWWLHVPIERSQNPMDSVDVTLRRLVSKGKVVAGKPWHKGKTYRLRSKFTAWSLQWKSHG